MKQLWIVGYFIRAGENGTQWNFVGVFDRQDIAESECTDSNHFVAPAQLNELAPTEFPWKGLYYPKQKSIAKGK